MTNDQSKHFGLALSALSLLAACHGEQPIDQILSPDAVYGTITPVKGFYEAGEEAAELRLCETSRKQCAWPKKNPEKCWVEFSSAAQAQVSKLWPRNLPASDFGKFWLEGRGRIARQPGSFGHLGAYSCQVEFIEVQALKTDYPQLWQKAPAGR